MKDVCFCICHDYVNMEGHCDQCHADEVKGVSEDE